MTIEAWLKEFIIEFRQQSDGLSKKERPRISNLSDFFPPCQVLLLWFKNANLQYLICTHDGTKSDMEIEIQGPIPTHEAIHKLDEILKDPKWNRELAKEEKKLFYDKAVDFSGILEGVFLSIFQELRVNQFQKPPSTSLIKSMRLLVSRDFIWGISGDISKLNKTEIVTKIIEEARKEVARAKTKPTMPPPPKTRINSCVTFFYPPIWVGKLPKKTFKEKALRSYVRFPKKALDLKYKDRVVVINKDGLIAIGEEVIPKAARMLNEIMATFLLLGVEANAVRELEVDNAKIDPASLSITEWGIRTHTLRTQLAQFFPPQPLEAKSRIEIEKGRLVRLIKQAERINKDPDISDFLIFFLEAHTHLHNSEYSQSFVMSWVIIERQMYWLWKKFLKEEQMPRKRREKLTNPVYWTIDFVLEGLNLGGQLSKEDYCDLMFLKRKRNDIIHQGESVALDEAEKCFRIAKDVVRQRSGLD